MNQEQVNNDLKEKGYNESKFQTDLIDTYRRYMVQSSWQMSEYWGEWDEAHRNYCAYRLKDPEDKRNESKGGTSKIIIPLSYAQVQTAVASLLGMFNQKERLFELMTYGPEDTTIKEGLERDIDYQIKYNKFYYTLYLQILDAVVKGVGIGRCDWITEKRKYRVREKREASSIFQSMLSVLGLGSSEPTYEEVEVVKELIQYEGNQISYVSPYTFFPDPNVALRDFQQGSYCAIEQSVPKTTIKDFEGDLYHGTDKIPNSYSQQFWNARKRYAGTFATKDSWNKSTEMEALTDGRVSTGSNYDIVEMYIKLIPKEYKEKYDIDIGDESKPVMFVMVVANDEKVIRFERYNELHGKFPFYCMQYSPNGDSFVGQSIPGLLEGIQTFMTWLINSHMANVRKTVRNRLIVDQSKIEVKDIEAGNDIIRSKGLQGITNAVTQLQVVDITAQHIPFTTQLNMIAQMTTGINENMQGQYSSGRRSAAQTRGIQAAGATRIGMAGNLMWYGGLADLGDLLVSNTRQFRTKEVYDQLMGSAAEQYPFDKVILGNPQSIAGGMDFIPLDAVTDSGKVQALQLFQELLKNPQFTDQLGLDIKKLLMYIFEVLGIKNYNYFEKPQQPVMQQPAQPQQVQVMPDNQVQQMAQQGQIVPDQSGNLIGQILSQLGQ